MTGAEVASAILDAAQIRDVWIYQTRGLSSDHYSLKKKTIYLSADIYGKSTIAAVAIASHESAHAVQHAKCYAFLGLFPVLSLLIELDANRRAKWMLRKLNLVSESEMVGVRKVLNGQLATYIFPRFLLRIYQARRDN